MFENVVTGLNLPVAFARHDRDLSMSTFEGCACRDECADAKRSSGHSLTMERGHFLSLIIYFVFCLSTFFPIEGFPAPSWLGSSRHRTRRQQPSKDGRHLRVLAAQAASSTGDAPQRRVRQVRKKSQSRRPPCYWQDIENVERELCEFWSHLGIKLPDNGEPPTIPNEALLNHFERNDLRYAIVSYRGRKALSARLGGARVMPGRWTQAVKTSPELQALLLNSTHGLSPDLPPRSPQQKKQQRSDNGTIESNVSQSSDARQVRIATRWNHSPSRKPPGYWSLKMVFRELYQYLDEYQEQRNRPSIWMPRLNEFKRQGRDDLRQAIVRFGGHARICKLAGLVPFREWHYFEGQYELLVDLRDYLDKYHNGNQRSFPRGTEMQRNGYHQLYALTQYYGGTKYVANRLSMNYIHTNAAQDYADLNWGPFSIDTAIDLLRFIRADQMKKKGPLKRPVIAIPSQRKLLASGQEKLHEEIMELGGYENVARRLGLAYFD